VFILHEFKLSVQVDKIVQTQIACSRELLRIQLHERDLFNTKTIDNLKQSLSELEKKFKEKKRKTNNMKGIEVDIVEDIQIDNNYLTYIQRYGVPEDGIFDPVLLMRCSSPE
tara:strand:+ start:772 stop:1107 length:336 start_codon:yes stop_codon:yes gene_type:complete